MQPLTVVGTDIIEIERIEHAALNQRFMTRFFTESERLYLKNKRSESVAGIFAAKEAVSKALGTGFKGFSLIDIEITHDLFNKPMVKLHRGAEAQRIKAGLNELNVSITHCREYACATAVADKIIPWDVININRDIVINLPKRSAGSNKGTNGKVAVIAGSDDMPGSSVLSATAAYRTGCGLVKVFSTKRVTDTVHCLLPEAVTATMPDKGGFMFDASKILEQLNGFSIAVIGPGLGNNDTTAHMVAEIIKHSNVPLIIDADALNIVSRDTKILNKLKSKAVITPHIGEFSRLTGLDPLDIAERQEELADSFAREFGVITVLKDWRTAVSAPDGKKYLNAGGCSALAKAGSGDVLTGIIAGLAAQGAELFEAAKMGVYIHTLSGIFAAERLGDYGVLARDVTDQVPIVMKRASEINNQEVYD